MFRSLLILLIFLISCSNNDNLIFDKVVYENDFESNNSKNKIDIYTEVQGIVNLNGNVFKEGKTFKKNDKILSIKSDEFSTSVKQARSELQNLIASILPDIKIDFNKNFNSWNNYFQEFDVENEISELPSPKSDKEKF